MLELAAADGACRGRRHFAGSVKWLGTPFDGHDPAALRRGAAAVPGFTQAGAGLAAVTLSGLSPNLDPRDVDLVWRPDDVVAAWRPEG